MVAYKPARCFAICCLIGTVFGNPIVVNTPPGAVRGITVSVENDSVYQYRRIPFAKAPIGNLRLRKPVPFGKWTGTLDGTEFGPSCMQRLSNSFRSHLLPNRNVSEDCLQLNVYVPNNTLTGDRKSVMIWIHGGAYLFGQAIFYDASYLAHFGDVIVVTINYRLGVLGFLSTMDSSCKGNYGLWDQQLAIRWVHENIEAFGGNKHSVTIFGESAGGFSVGLQAINPSNVGLFQRAIAESGTALSFVTYTNTAKDITSLVLKNLNCSKAPFSNNNDKVNCLRTKTAEEILQADIKAQSQLPIRMGLGLGPVIDGDFLVDDPSKLLLNKTSKNLQFFRSLDYMTGIMNSEGSLVFSFTGPQLQPKFKFDILKGIPTRVLCNRNGLAFLLTEEHYNDNNAIQNAICEHYKEDGSLEEQSRSVVKFYGDSLFVAPAAQSLNLHVANNNITSSFQYLFTRVPNLPASKPKQTWFHGAPHASELMLLFGIQNYLTLDPNMTLSEDDLQLSKEIQLYWSNFAKTGDPNNNSTMLPYWPRYDEFPDKHSFLILDVNIKQGTNLYKDSVKFWLETIPTITPTTNSVEKTSNYYTSIGCLFLFCSLHLK